MGLRNVLVALVVSVTLCNALQDSSSQLLVAFKCNKPAVYRSDNSWVEDRSTDCIEDPQEILDFCRKVYPTREITNVVESNELVTIDSWCQFDVPRCHKRNQHTVRPFRCLVGPFQSDALLVPEHCIFDHKHGRQCARYMQWNRTAHESCKNHSMRLDSFAMLQPCIPEVDVFNGVEFVCCPIDDDSVKPFIFEDDSDIQTPVIADNDASFWQPAPQDPNDIKADHNSLSSKQDQYNVKAKTTQDVYNNYIIEGDDADFYNEHEFFVRAKTDMQKHHHDRVAAMMKDWAAARQRVADMKNIDPKGGDTLEREITERFQKEYEALEQEGMEEKEQLTAIHQQRVQKELNDKKRDAMEHYMQVLTDPNPDAGVILKALRHYVKTEEKDRLHSLNHYRHVQESVEEEEDPTQDVEAAREQALDHMEIIDQRINQAVDMLRRVPDFEPKIRQQIADYLETFKDLDIAIANSLMKLPEPTEPEVIEPQAPVVSEQARTYEQLGDELLERVESEERDEKQWPQPGMDKDNNDIRGEPIEQGFGLDTFDDEIMEDEHDLPEMHQVNVAQASHVRNDRMNLKLMDDPKVRMQSGKSANSVYGASTTAGIAVAAVAVFVILVVGGLLLKKKNSTRSRRGFIAVDQNASPEERHVANMQMNGYENPTYKYFEMGSSNASA